MKEFECDICDRIYPHIDMIEVDGHGIGMCYMCVIEESDKEYEKMRDKHDSFKTSVERSLSRIVKQVKADRPVGQRLDVIELMCGHIIQNAEESSHSLLKEGKL